MERVAFLVEESGLRISCLLNPGSLTVRRTSGVVLARSRSGSLTSAQLSDDPVQLTGGGTTELELELLFDVSIASSGVGDVRELTGPLWSLSENGSTPGPGRAGPPLVRFVWGKAWNVPAVVVAIAERLESFELDGRPRRSWLKLRLRRVSEPTVVRTDQDDARALPLDADLAAITLDAETATHEMLGVGDESGERLDELAHRYYGHPSWWRLLAAINGIDDPLQVPPGTVLALPNPAGGSR
jgi:hypothetical protein